MLEAPRRVKDGIRLMRGWLPSPALAAPGLLSLSGLAWAFVSALDPARASGIWGGPILALAALALRSRRGGPTRALAFSAVLTAALAAGAMAQPGLRRGDFVSYYSYLRSAAFDHDLDFANEFESFGLPLPPLTPTGHRLSATPLGPALLWSPFFATAHLYVTLDNAIGVHRYRRDGNSIPYLRSTLAGTVTAVVCGVWLLVSVLERRFTRRIAVLAAVAAVTTSPLLVYTFAEPGMAHGGAFALACVGVWATDRAHSRPSLSAWLLLGAITGLIMLMRLQAVVFALLMVPLAVHGLLRRTVRPTWLLAGALAALVAFSPQLVAWKILYGRWLTASGGLGDWSAETGRLGDVLFRPDRSLDLSSPHLLSVLFSADRGLFSWTPGLLLGLVAFALGLRRWGLVGAGGLLVVVATAWFNGSYTVFWSAADSFGARRFDIVVPFVAFGYATLLALLARAPLVAPAMALASLTVWNLGLASLWRGGGIRETAALEDVATLQAHKLRRFSERVLDRLAGPRGRALAYDYFVGSFFFVNTAYDGVIDLGLPNPRFLTGGWSPPLNESGPPAFRLALYPRSCARIPLLRPVDLRAHVTARAPSKRLFPIMKVTFNGLALGQAALEVEWTETVVPLPASAMVPGENLLCLEFDDALPGPTGHRVAARVRTIVVH